MGIKGLICCVYVSFKDNCFMLLLLWVFLNDNQVQNTWMKFMHKNDFMYVYDDKKILLSRVIYRHKGKNIEWMVIGVHVSYESSSFKLFL